MVIDLRENSCPYKDIFWDLVNAFACKQMSHELAYNRVACVILVSGLYSLGYTVYMMAHH